MTHRAPHKVYKSESGRVCDADEAQPHVPIRHCCCCASIALSTLLIRAMRLSSKACPESTSFTATTTHTHARTHTHTHTATHGSHMGWSVTRQQRETTLSPVSCGVPTRAMVAWRRCAWVGVGGWLGNIRLALSTVSVTSARNAEVRSPILSSPDNGTTSGRKSVSQG
jgi:hypothetical protein